MKKNRVQMYPSKPLGEQKRPFGEAFSGLKMFDIIRQKTKSGDYYTGTIDQWAEYHQAWKDGDMEKVMKFEEGRVEGFFYSP